MIHYYYGNGKGKTSAAVGACIRAFGNNFKCVFVQFMKNGSSGELSILRRLGIPVYTCGQTVKFYRLMNADDKHKITEEQNANLTKLLNEKYDFIVLDELGDAVYRELLDIDLVMQLLTQSEAEIIITGHKSNTILMQQADYITEFQCKAHPYQKGIKARKGIEF